MLDATKCLGLDDSELAFAPLTDRDGIAVHMIGHSQGRALREAARLRSIRLPTIDFWFAPSPAFDEEHTAFHPDIAAFLSGATIVSAIGGTTHAVMGLVRHTRPFDFELPDRPDLPLEPGVEIIPFAAVRDAVATNLAGTFALISLVARSASRRVLHLETVPPLEDQARVASSVRWGLFGGMAQQVSPPALRYKFWCLEIALTRSFCERSGVGVLPVPAAARTESGFLRPDCFEDAMHANGVYGALVLADLMEWL